jgi:hypothetical protein
LCFEQRNVSFVITKSLVERINLLLALHGLSRYVFALLPYLQVQTVDRCETARKRCPDQYLVEVKLHTYSRTGPSSPFGTAKSPTGTGFTAAGCGGGLRGGMGFGSFGSGLIGGFGLLGIVLP